MIQLEWLLLGSTIHSVAKITWLVTANRAFLMTANTTALHSQRVQHLHFLLSSIHLNTLCNSMAQGHGTTDWAGGGERSPFQAQIHCAHLGKEPPLSQWDHLYPTSQDCWEQQQQQLKRLPVYSLLHQPHLFIQRWFLLFKISTPFRDLSSISWKSPTAKAGNNSNSKTPDFYMT